MKAIYKREWKSFFRSPRGYVFIAVFLALCSFYFINGSLIYQSADIGIIFSNINIVYLFLVCILTMGLFSNERSKKTDQLLFTSPVSIEKIVIGKYFAALSVFAITLTTSIIYPVILEMYGSPSLTETIGTYIGFILIWSVFIAIGMFISALTENQMISAVATFGVLIAVFYWDSMTLSITNSSLVKIIRWVSVMDRYKEFGTGIINVESVVYYLSISAAYVFLTIRVLHHRQYTDAKVRFNNTTVTTSVLVCIILINAIVSSVGAKTILKIDMTKNSVYTYSEHTKDVLASLDSDVELYALYPDDADSSYVNMMREYLSQYQQMNSKIKVIYKDPNEEPAFVRQYGNDITVGSVIVSCGERFKVVPFEKIYKQNQYTGAIAIDAEKQLTSAIGYVAQTQYDKKVYFIKGHNEHAKDASYLASELELAGYDIDELKLSAGSVPENADLVVSLAPSADFTQDERDFLDEYIINGGKAIFVLTPGTQPMERLYSYLEEWGINVNNDFVIETDAANAFPSKSGIPIPAPTLQKHIITEKLLKNDVSFISPNSCSFALKENNIQKATVTSLLETSKASYGITDFSTTSLEKKDGDIQGPLTIAAMSEKGGKIFVLGSLHAIETQDVLTESSYCNGEFVLNTVSYLTDRNDSFNIRAKIISPDVLLMTEEQMNFIIVLVQYVVPVFVLLVGLVIWLKRKNL